MNNEQMMDKLRKELLLTRVFTMITSLLLICLLVGGFFLYTKAQEYITYMEGYIAQVEGYIVEVRPAMEQLTRLDVKELNETLVKMNAVVEEVDWQKVSNQLEAFDIEALNEAIAGLDTKELTNALETMNNAVDKLRKISEAFSNFAAKFGFRAD